MHAHVPPVALSFWRWAVALLAAGFAAPHQKRGLPILWRHRGTVALLAFLGAATFNSLAYHGLTTTSVVNGVILESTMPVLILAGSMAIFGEPIRAHEVVAILVSLAGVAVIITGGSLGALS